MRGSSYLLSVVIVVSALAWVGCGDGASDSDEPTGTSADAVSSNPQGEADSFSIRGRIDTSNAFFKGVGNGRACVSCHQPSDGWTIIPSNVRKRFDATGGTDPIFRTNDGSNSPNADVSTINARRSAYSMLLTKGLIRVGIKIPSNAEFTLDAVEDPYRFASAAELSLFRRPLPTSNVAFLSATMWDGRETTNGGKSVREDLMHQANEATTTHAQAPALSPAQQAEIADFELALFFAQTSGNQCGNLTASQGRGGPRLLSSQAFFIGINDPIGLNPQGVAFNPRAMTLFDAWNASTPAASNSTEGARGAVRRGQELFNTRQFQVSGVRGVNDELGVSSLTATCTTCHDSPNVGNHSVPFPVDLGLTDASRRTPDMPLYTLRNKANGQLIKTTDPGRALITGKWKDVARFKGPVLRGLGARAPYFHNGSAPSLEAVVSFYDDRFQIGLSASEEADLVAFLGAL
jgi:cytochrome c peroxidase